MASLFKKLPNSTGNKRLLLFHHAGGNGTQYFPSVRPHAQVCEIFVLDMPGRFLRLDEKLFTNIEDLARALKNQVMELPPLPTYLLGHSFGSMIAYSLASELSANPLPFALRGVGLSALPTPSAEKSLYYQNSSRLSDHELFIEIEKYSELPAIVKQQPHMLSLTLKALRVDFSIMASFRPSLEKKLSVPSLVFGGDADPQVSPQDLEGWRDLIEMKKNPLLLKGDHFYIFSQMSKVLEELFQL